MEEIISVIVAHLLSDLAGDLPKSPLQNEIRKRQILEKKKEKEEMVLESNTEPFVVVLSNFWCMVS